MSLNREAALKATSWGMFQILGANYRVAGFDTVENYVRAQMLSEGEHLKSFVHFVILNHLDDELRDRRWEDFAKSYNGPGYKQNHYDQKMAQAYTRLSAGFLAPTAGEIQTALNRHGADLVVDGITGPTTHSAIRAFQNEHGLVVDGVTGPKTLAALGLRETHDPVALSATMNA
jgi:hypothetical protein